eukprot:TRINITY_DN2418_c0_g1_i1.p1 TRINITY_DN2418_c0_g1~~TRINITY_DN2418_c0_g1_i1.p1  ORF type:complete len:142 (+),score=21.77 TRINITY_DN2418_c0_g1_i1:111-536(+)
MFHCSICKRDHCCVGSSGFFSIGLKVYCLDCYWENAKCSICNQVMIGSFLFINFNNQLHSIHPTCKSSFFNQSNINHLNEPDIFVIIPKLIQINQTFNYISYLNDNQCNNHNHLNFNRNLAFRSMDQTLNYKLNQFKHLNI